LDHEPIPFSGPRGSRTLISGVRSQRRPVGPAAQSMIPDGLEPSLPGCRPGVVAAGPRDRRSSRGGNRTHNLSPGSRPGRFANLRTQPSSCGGRIRTGVERLMRPCWKPDSSPLRSDQGESRTPTPVTARRSERRVSASSTTWPGSPYGNRTHPSGLRGRRPFADRRTGRQCVGQELNLHSVTRVGYSHLGSPMPSRRMMSSSTGGNRTHKRSPRFELGRFAGLRTVPASVPDGIRTHDLHRDRVASTPGCSTRTITSGPGGS
jgi:hypothetical protein